MRTIWSSESFHRIHDKLRTGKVRRFARTELFPFVVAFRLLCRGEMQCPRCADAQKLSLDVR